MFVWKLLILSTRCTHFCTLGFQSENQTFAPLESNRKPWKALLASVLLTKHTAPEKKPSDRSNATRPGEVEERRCTGHAYNKSLRCEECARVVQIALRSASTNKNCILCDSKRWSFAQKRTRHIIRPLLKWIYMCSTQIRLILWSQKIKWFGWRTSKIL